MTRASRRMFVALASCVPQVPQANRATPNHLAARGIHDYVSDLLFNEIQPETLVAFGGDPAFLAAYHFPGRD
jgi:hypothetical protein